jgi:hypothetical protein
MATKAITTSDLSASAAKDASERYPAVTLKQRFENLVRQVFEGHEEYLGLTPD